MNGPRGWFLAGLAAAQVAALAACHPTPGEKAVIERWLLCEECTAGELDAVAALGDRATGTLRDALRDGPSQSDREHIRRHAASRYTRLRAPTITLPRWVDHYDSSYVQHYQAHAATALGRIGTPDARAALLDAMQRDTAYGRDVLRALAGAAPVALATTAGDSQAAPRDSAVLVSPTVMVRDSATGRPLANVSVVFTVDSGGGRADSLQRTDAQGRVAARWVLGPGPDSANLLRADAFRRRVRFHATAHGFTPRLAFSVQPTGGTQGQPLAPGIKAIVVDAWDQRDTTFSGTALATIIGTVDMVKGPVVKGVVDLPTIVPSSPGLGLRIRVQAVGATPVVSAPFDVGP